MADNLMKKNKRGRPSIKPFIKILISEKATTDRKMPRLALAVELKQLIEEIGEVPPTEETIIQMISKSRRVDHYPEDDPWSLATLEQYPLAPEAIPSVLKVWVYHEEHYWEEVSEEKEPGMQFSIRDAKWAARLYSAIKDIKLLTIAAVNYAFFERVAKTLDLVFDSTELDLMIYSYITGEKVTGTRRETILAGRIGGDSLKDFKDILNKLSTYEKSYLWGSVIKPKIKQEKNQEEA